MNVSFLEVPVIDFGRAYSDALPDRQALARSIGEVVEDIGFLVLSNHGVDAAVKKEAEKTTWDFFSLPEEIKKQASPPSSNYYRGYFGMETGNLGATLGDDDALPDLREYFTFNKELSESPDPYYQTQAAQAIFLPNIWPDQYKPSLKPAMLAYYQEMEKLAQTIMRIWALALDLDEYWFDSKIDKHMTNLVMSNYPEQNQAFPPNQMRAGAHTDYGSLTILNTEAKPGLQVKNKLGEWKDVPIVEDSFIINLGDLMAYWTNDKWVSNVHRVVNPPESAGSSRRQSIIFFHQPNHDAVIECIPSCVSDKTYPVITSLEHLTMKMNAMNDTVKYKQIGQ